MPAEPQLSTTTGVKSFCMVVSKLLTGPHTGQPPTGRGGTVTAGLELRDQPGLRPTRDLLSISLLKSEKIAQLQNQQLTRQMYCVWFLALTSKYKAICII